MEACYQSIRGTQSCAGGRASTEILKESPRPPAPSHKVSSAEQPHSDPAAQREAIHTAVANKRPQLTCPFKDLDKGLRD